MHNWARGPGDWWILVPILSKPSNLPSPQRRMNFLFLPVIKSDRRHFSKNNICLGKKEGHSVWCSLPFELPWQKEHRAHVCPQAPFCSECHSSLPFGAAKWRTGKRKKMTWASKNSGVFPLFLVHLKVQKYKVQSSINQRAKAFTSKFL